MDVAMTSTGSPISAIDDVTPTAFEEANALIGSIDDVNGMDGTYGIRVTMADVMGTGFKVDAMYTTDVGSGDAQADNGTSGELGGTSGDGQEITITGSVPMVEGLDVGVGYYNQDTESKLTTGNFGQDEGTAYIKYSTGPVSVGYSKAYKQPFAVDATSFTGTSGTAYSALNSNAIGDSNVPYNSWGTPNSTYYRWVLPKAGTYRIESSMRIRLWGVHGMILSRVYNNTTSAVMNDAYGAPTTRMALENRGGGTAETLNIQIHQSF